MKKSFSRSQNKNRDQRRITGAAPSATLITAPTGGRREFVVIAFASIHHGFCPPMSPTYIFLNLPPSFFKTPGSVVYSMSANGNR